MKAYAGRVLKIDLSTQTSAIYPWSEKDREMFLGGKIMAAKILYDLLEPKVESLSKENILVISTGPLTNTGAPASSRFNISTISPLTNLLTSSNCGGSFGLILKKTGYDALIISGRSRDKLHLEVLEDQVIFHSADELWGMDTEHVQEVLPKRHGKLVIGPAGENLVRFAGVFSGERTAGRGGIGAVFGYKRIKAITCFGSRKTETAHEVKSFYKSWIEKLRKHPLTGHQLPTYGTAGLVTIMDHRKILATKNFKSGTYQDFEQISGERLKRDHLIKNKGCITCPIQCGRQVAYEGKKIKGPELETIGLFGANILNNDMEAIIRWNYKLDLLGMDSISTAGVLAFMMELNEKGLLKSDLKFGDISAIDQTLEDIAYRRGLGQEMAEGVKHLSEKYGGKDFAIHSKGMELSAYEPRNAVGQGLGYAVSNRCGCHINAGYLVLFEGLSMAMNPKSQVNKAEFTIFSQDVMEACSAAGMCIFTLQAMLPDFVLNKPNHWLTRFINRILTTKPVALGLSWINRVGPNLLPIHLPMIPHTKALSLATGFKIRLGEFKTIGERGFNLERLINISRGLEVSHDDLPKRLKTNGVPLDALKQHFYECRGWHENGHPSDKTRRKLGI